jgi:hypothetical protein
MEKIVQIMAAPAGLVAVFEDEPGKTNQLPVICLGLTEEGEIFSFTDLSGPDQDYANFVDLKFAAA